jgi:CDP-glycerol glycerophosphotransferase (TagB/SpsB family)
MSRFIVTDQLVNKAVDATRVRRRLELDNKLPIVLYAPSWSDNPEMVLMSEDILSALHRQEQFNIIVKPHPLLLRPSRTHGKDYGKILSQLSSERFRVATEADVPIQEYMIVSDILISDISSVVFEFLFLDRPILLHTNNRVISFYEGEDYLNDILPAVSLFETAEQLPAKLRMEFGNPNALSLERKRFVAREYYNVGRATDAAVRSVYRHLDLAPPERCNASGDE